MSAESHSWYVRGEGNQPAGPFTAEELIESVRSGQRSVETVCWREGLAEWLPLAQAEPFAAALAAAAVPAKAAAGVAAAVVPGSAAARIGAPPIKRERDSAAWIGWAVTGGIAVICAVVAIVYFAGPNNSTGHSPTPEHSSNQFSQDGTPLADSGKAVPVSKPVSKNSAVPPEPSYEKSIAAAREAMANRRWQEVIDQLNAASANSSNRFQNDPQASEMLLDARFGLTVNSATELFNSGQFERALAAVDGLLTSRPDNSAAKELREKICGRLCDQLIERAKQAGDKHEWAEVRQILEEASTRFPDQFQSDARANELLKNARFALAMDSAKAHFQKDELDEAKAADAEALGIRPDDAEATALRDKISPLLAAKRVREGDQALHAKDFETAAARYRAAIELLPSDPAIPVKLDAATVEQHCNAADKAIADNALDNAVAELLAARETFEKRPGERTFEPLRKSLDDVRDALVTAILADAKKQYDCRNYESAKQRASAGLKVAPKQADLVALAGDIDRQLDPERADISGKWLHPRGGKFRLTKSDKSTAKTERYEYEPLNLPQGVIEYKGFWIRSGTSLEGHISGVFSRHPNEKFRGTVHATIKDASTLVVLWNDINWIPGKNPRAKPTEWVGVGKATWKIAK